MSWVRSSGERSSKSIPKARGSFPFREEPGRKPTMSINSAIEWTTSTWNPVSGCTKISTGCLNCYAERMARRLQAMGQRRYRNGFKVTLHPEALEEPYTWKKPRIVFVNSMSDLFHKNIPLEFIRQIFQVMNENP